MTAACVLLLLALGLALPAGAQNYTVVGNIVIKSESCPPTNNVVDPGETVTVDVTFKNNDATATPGDAVIDFAASAAGGVYVPTTANNSFSGIAAGGSVTKTFTFRAGNTNDTPAFFCGETITLTFNVTSAGTPARNGTATKTQRLGVISEVATAFNNNAAIPIVSPVDPLTQAAATASSVVVGGLTASNAVNDAKIKKVTVTIFGLTHSYTRDIDMVLVGPGGQKVMLMSDVGGVPGGTTAVNNINLTFDSTAAANLPEGTQLLAGTFKPTDAEPAAGELNEVAGVYGTDLGVFNNLDPKDLNGTWTLYVKDDQINDGGNIAAGWTLTVTEELGSCCVPGLPTIAAVADQTTNEDTLLQVNLTIGDNETPLNNLTLTATSTNQTVIANTGVTFSGTGANRVANIVPVLNQSGTTRLTITVTDGDGKTASTSFQVVVNAVNDSPTITDIANRSTGIGVSTGAISFTVGDVETAAGSLSLFSNSSNTTLVPNANVVFGGSGADRTVTVTPAANQFGSATITVGVVDAQGATSQDTFVLSVASPGNPTITDIGNQTANEDVPVVINFTVNDVETHPTNLVVTVSSSNTTVVPNTTGGLALVTADPVNNPTARTLTITPVANASGTATVTITVRDTDNRTATDTFDVTFISVLDPPTITGLTDKTTAEDTAVGASFTVNDVDTSNVSLSAVSSNPAVIPNGSIIFSGTGSSRTVVVVPAVDASGVSTITITATATLGGSTVTTTGSFNVTVTPVNDLPVITGIANRTILEDTSTNLTFSVGDNETHASSLQVTFSSSDQLVLPNANLVLSGGPVNYTLAATPLPNANGKTLITINVTDRGALDNNTAPGTTSTTFELRVSAVQDAPSVTLSQNAATIAEDASISFTATIADIETAAANLVLTAVSTNATLVPPANVTFTGTGATRTVTIQPGTNQFGGPTTIQIVVSDADTNGVLLATNNFALTITAVEDVPTISDITDKTVGKNQALTTVPFTVNDPEGFASPAVVGTSSDQALVLNSNILIAGSGSSRTVTVVPQPNVFGVLTITLTATDLANNTAVDTFQLTIQDRNTPPTITAIANQSVDEDSITAPIAFTVDDGAETPAANLTIFGISRNTDLVPSENIVPGGAGAARNVRIVPAPNKSGQALIDVYVVDQGVPPATNRTTFTLTVNDLPDAPSLTGLNITTNINEDASVTLNFTVSDPETPSTNLTVTASSGNTNLITAAGITLGGTNGSRSITLSPVANASGTAVITVTVADGTLPAQGGPLTAVGTITVNVASVNDQPTITDIANKDVDEDQASGDIFFTVGDVETAQHLLTVTGTSGNTTLVPNANIVITLVTNTLGNRKVVVTPAANQSGTAEITIQVVDTQASVTSTNTDKFVFTVRSLNDNPTLTNGNGDQTVPEDSTLNLNITVGDVETAVGSLTVTATSSNQSLVQNSRILVSGTTATRTLTITPENNGVGSTVITITVADASGGTVTGSFNLTYTPLNDLPTISAITDKSTAEDSPTAPIAFTVADAETAASSLIVSGTSSDTNKVPHQNIAFSGSGNDRFAVIRPANDANGDVNITITVKDGNGATASTTFKLTIAAQGDSPTISSIAEQTTQEDTASPLIAFTVSDNETAGADIIVTASSSDTSIVPNGSIYIGASAGNRTLTVIPAQNKFGTVTITITARDGSGQTTTASFNLNIQSANDVPTISAIADQTIPENGATAELAFTVGDVETPAARLALVKSSSNTTLVPTANITLSGTESNRTVTVTPAAGRSGSADISIRVVDENNGESVATFKLTVTEVNDAPEISAISDRTESEGAAISVNFTVNDNETATSNLTVVATSSNTTLLPNASITINGTGTIRTLVATPVVGLSGSSTITVTVTDSGSPALSATDSFVLTITEVNRNDFNGDGLSDIVFQNTDGFLAAWFMNGTNRLATTFLNPNNPGDIQWRVVGTGDFNADAKGDLLFQHQNGTLSVWYMDGVNRTGSALLNPSSAGDAGWRVVATGDFNNDGQRDIVFQHTSGLLSIWFMNGVNLQSNVLVNPSTAGDTSWIVVAASDLNADSKTDLIFQHTDGTLAVWYMDGATRVDTDVLNPENAGADLRVSGVANYAGSNQGDLILQNSNGDLQLWIMTGTHGATRSFLNPANAGQGWFVVGPK